MATASLDIGWNRTINDTSANYRTLTVHLEKGLPVLVGDDAHAIRVRRGGEPHRKANGIGEEFSVAADPLDQPNPLADGIRLSVTAWLVNSPPLACQSRQSRGICTYNVDRIGDVFLTNRTCVTSATGLRMKLRRPPLFSLGITPWECGGSTPYLVRPIVGKDKSRGAIFLVDR